MNPQWIVTAKVTSHAGCIFLFFTSSFLRLPDYLLSPCTCAKRDVQLFLINLQHQDLLKKKKKPSKVKERKSSAKSPKPSSPLISRPIAALAASKFNSNDAHELSQVVKISSSPLRIRRREWADKQRVQRSCSLDALDMIGAKEEQEVTSSHTPDIKIRRCSTEASGIGCIHLQYSVFT